MNVAITDRCVQLLALQQTAAVEVKAEFRFVYFFSRNLIGSFFLFYTQPSIFAPVSAYKIECYQIGYMSFSFFFCYSLVGNFIEYISGGYFYKTNEIAKFSILEIVSIPYWYKKNIIQGLLVNF